MKRTALLILLVFPLALLAQEEKTEKRHNWMLAFDFGTNDMSRKLIRPEQIREDRYTGYYNYNDGDYGFFGGTNWMSTSYLSVKPEFFIFNNRVGIASGVRVTTAQTHLVSDRDNFLWRVQEDGLTTDYVRIKDIWQRSYMAGIPLEIRVFPNDREWPVQPYFKIGASFNYRFHTKYRVNFLDGAMGDYGSTVQKQLSSGSSAFSSFLYGAFGLNVSPLFEKSWAPWWTVEIQFPYILLTKNSFAFGGATNIPGIGFQTSFAIPLGKRAPIGSRELNH